MAIKTDVLILVEHKVREFETAVLTKCFFERKGYSVRIDSIRFNKEKTFLKYNPKIVFLPYAYSNSSTARAQALCRFNNRPLFVNYHHEQIGFDGKYTHLPIDEATKTIHLSWGNKFTKALIDAGCDEKTILTLGNPRLDFYSRRLERINRSRVELSKKYNLDPNKKWILYIGDPGYLCLKNVNPANADKVSQRRDYYETGAYNRQQFFDFIRQLPLAEYEFIYRPHPSYAELDRNDESTLQMLQCPAFHFVSGETIRNWILNVDKVITFCSTSCLECAAAGVPFYLFRIKENLPKFEYTMLKGYSYKITSFDTFVAALNSPSMDFEAFKKAVEGEICFDNVGSIIEKLVDCSIAFYEEGSLGRIGYKHINVTKTRLKSFAKGMIGILRRIPFIDWFIRKKKDIRLLNVSEYGEDVFTIEEIDELTTKIASLLGK